MGRRRGRVGEALAERPAPGLCVECVAVAAGTPATTHGASSTYSSCQCPRTSIYLTMFWPYLTMFWPPRAAPPQHHPRQLLHPATPPAPGPKFARPHRHHPHRCLLLPAAMLCIFHAAHFALLCMHCSWGSCTHFPGACKHISGQGQLHSKHFKHHLYHTKTRAACTALCRTSHPREFAKPSADGLQTGG